MKYCLGIDIGGTKTAVALADLSGNIIVKNNFPTESFLGAESLVTRIKNAYEALCETKRIRKQDVSFAGVACPGPLDIKNGVIVHIATMGFRNVPIRKMLSEALDLTVFLQNDANCAALAESVMGTAKGADPLVYVTISTGIGCGIIVNGKILSGAFSSAGELGHLTVEPDGRKCPCGKSGCLELYSSGTAIAKDATDLRGISTDTKTAFVLARSGDEEMKKIIDNAAEKLGLALSSVYHLIDPEVIVLGGSVTKDYNDFAETLQKSLTRHTQPVTGRKFNVKISNFNGEQVILGAILYAMQSIEVII